MKGMLSELVEQALEVRPLSREQALWVLSYPEERVVELVGAGSIGCAAGSLATG